MRAPHPLGHRLGDIVARRRRTDLPLALELLELIHMQFGGDPNDVAQAVAGVMGGMEPAELLKEYNARIMAWHQRATKDGIDKTPFSLSDL